MKLIFHEGIGINPPHFLCKIFVECSGHWLIIAGMMKIIFVDVYKIYSSQYYLATALIRNFLASTFVREFPLYDSLSSNHYGDAFSQWWVNNAKVHPSFGSTVFAEISVIPFCLCLLWGFNFLVPLYTISFP